ncbi:hypothetical protein [Streptomyces sp. NPDC001492]
MLFEVMDGAFPEVQGDGDLFAFTAHQRQGPDSPIPRQKDTIQPETAASVATTEEAKWH